MKQKLFMPSNFTRNEVISGYTGKDIMKSLITAGILILVNILIIIITIKSKEAIVILSLISTAFAFVIFSRHNSNSLSMAEFVILMFKYLKNQKQYKFIKNKEW